MKWLEPDLQTNEENKDGDAEIDNRVSDAEDAEKKGNKKFYHRERRDTQGFGTGFTDNGEIREKSPPLPLVVSC